MNKRNSHNSILFLTTLGVYLGLVLVGATPVLGHAAMTRNFEIKDEIEVKDDLDTIPDDERSPVSMSVQIYLEDLEYFLASLRRLQAKGKFDPNKDTFDLAQSTLLPCTAGNKAGSYTPIRFDTSSEPSRAALEYYSRGMVYGYSLGDCVTNNSFDGVSAASSKFDVRLDRKSLSINVAVKKQSPQLALELVRELSATFLFFSSPKNAELRKKIIENTTFKTENDQVFVVTRLPRAGLDTLLAKSAM